MKVIQLKVRGKSFPIVIGHNSVKKSFIKEFPRNEKRAVLIFDKNLKTQAIKIQKDLAMIRWSVSLIEVIGSEDLKSFKSIERIYEKLIRFKMDRRSTLISLGGGSVGDAAGFVAATYMRGMDWVNIPTTLLAQVDSAIGGKTAVNHKLGKNMIGLVYQPKLVVVDPSYLSSLGLRDQISGLGELLKYGLCFDRELFKELTAGKFSLEKVISRALKIKVGVVEKDEFDLKGVREVLNFGHTVGHALEKCARFGEFRHGEAVILGMRVEAVISRIRGHLSRDVQRKIDWELARVQIPKVPKSVTFKKIGEAIENDKKKIGGKVRFVLLKGIGKTVLDSGVKTSEIEQAWREVVG